MFQLEAFKTRRLIAGPGARKRLRGLVTACFAATLLMAQDDTGAQPLPPPRPDAPAATALPPTVSSALPGIPVSMALSAQFSNDRRPIKSGLVWRVLADTADGSPMRIVARSTDAEPVFSLEPGTYVLHAAYGFASGTKRVTLGQQGLRDQVSISAGGLTLGGSIGEVPIQPAQLSFSVFVPLQGNSEGRLVVGNAKAGEVIRLPEGTYHVVSTYGDSNAIQRADVVVESGKVTDATLHHRAARVTLKLVAAAGGEAFAGTAFSVLTPGGDVIREAIGAFPQVILAEGDYVLIARQEGQVYSRDFKVESGLDRDIEVLAK
ncbi:hypothetical protein DWF00_11050 [Bosea caraganae]|uniref:Uncharacterized protein n=2 Tax=Bosea caraganae TaxID=2763117 RepID=A0A370LD84_9HYPH|nr:hypothetical protein [Bosea caraganae]RDJ27480.1 hypothetical protein DWF00_11050 [Bosea caraganae]RDJ29495.1 hypothetical protein DWE98_02820 [Bosea caraganae]